MRFIRSEAAFTLGLRSWRIEARWSALPAVGLTVALIAGWVLTQSRPWATALAVGLAAAGVHWLALLVHHFGHALAARSVGAPMAGVRLWGWLGTSLYPTEERPLTAAEHRRRATGGPLISLALGVASLLMAGLLEPTGRWQWLAILLAADSLLIFTLGSLFPLGFNDGSTLLRYWRRAGDPTDSEG